MLFGTILSAYKRHGVISWPAVLVLFLFLSDIALACQCSGPGPTPCQAIGPHSTIFLGVVDSIETPSFLGFLKVVSLRSPVSFREQYWSYADNVTVVFTAEEWFSGQSQKIPRVHIRRFIGACGFEFHPGDLFFHKGERYLVYAGEKNGLLSTNHCSRTRHALVNDDAEITTLRRLHQLPPGVVTGFYVLPYVFGPSAPVVGANVTLTSPSGQRFAAKTDADGVFTFSALPAATYQIQLDTQPGYVIDWATKAGAFWLTHEGAVPANAHEVAVAANACRDASYSALPDSHISGVATSPRAKLPEPIKIRIWPADRVHSIENFWWAQYETDATGAFQTGPLLPGRYILGTYLWPPDFKERSKDTNYLLNVVPQAWFYPGTADPAKARPITVGFARKVSGLRFVIPPASVKIPQKHQPSLPTPPK